MNYLENVCFLCLKHDKDTTSHDNINITSKMLEKLQFFVPGNLIKQSQNPKHICGNCCKSLNNIFEFRQKWIQSIKFFNYYVHELTHKKETCKYLSIDLDKISHQINSEISNELEILHENPNQGSSDEIFKIKTEEIQKDIENIEQVYIKTENTDNDDVKMENETNMLIMEEDCKDGNIFGDATTNASTYVQNSEKTLTCNICQKTFLYPSQLKKHKVVHTVEYPFTCDVCQKTFTRMDSLERHKFIHTGIRPYVCDVCEKTFGDRSNYMKHKRIHSDERSYACDICPKTFRRNDTLTIHKRSHNSKNYIKSNGKVF